MKTAAPGINLALAIALTFALVAGNSTLLAKPGDNPESSAAGEPRKHVRFANPEEEVSPWTWIPVTLDQAEQELFASRSETAPVTALDYYLLLSSSYFDNVKNSLERRITFIDRQTLTDHYLHAAYTIPQVDAGAFWVTIRLFETGEKDGEPPLIAIRHRRGYQSIHRNSRTAPGEISYIRIGRPEFWHYRDGQWFAADGSALLPTITPEELIRRYQSEPGSHLVYPDRASHLTLGYRLSPTGNIIYLTGRESYTRPEAKYTWATFTFDGTRFAPAPTGPQP